MEFRKEIIWSPSAKEDLENLTDYLKLHWGLKVLSGFLIQLNRIMNQLSANPEQFPLINSDFKVRKCVVTRQNTIYYRTIENKVEIIRLFDNRQDPKKLKILFK